MYIAINKELFREYPQRAIQFAIRKETVIDILTAVYTLDEYEKYTILYVR